MGISKVILNGVVKVDLTQDTVDETNLLAGETATGADGEAVEGAIASKSSIDLTVSGATVTAPAGFYSAAASKSVATTTHPNPTASINSTTGVVTASHTQGTGYVTGGTTTGTLNLTTQAGKTVTPTETEQTVVAAGLYTTGAVKVGAISSTYIGSDIAQRDSDDLTASGATVIVPAGYYSAAASKAVASGSAGTPTATKGTVSNHSVSVTPSVTNTTGYITGGTKTGTAVTVSASELVSGTLTINSSGTKDVTNYASASVAAGTEGTPIATKGTVSNHSVTVTPSVTNAAGYITGGTKTGTAVTVSVAELESGTKSITENGTGISVSGYSTVDVDVDGSDVFLVEVAESNGVWSPTNCTYAEAKAAYDAGKTVVFQAENGFDVVQGNYNSSQNGFVFSVFIWFDDWAGNAGYTPTSYRWNTSGVTYFGEMTYRDTSSADAQPSEVVEGKIFYNEDGYQVGTMSSVSVGPLTVTQNGTYTAPSGTAYSPVIVDVSSGSTKAEEKDVNFIDYDGTILYSYTASEFANLTALPNNPSRAGLTAQGWNWSLSDAKTYVAKYGKLIVGQMYITTSDATEIDITLTAPDLHPYLGITLQGTVVIDWGDGTSTDTVTGDNASALKFTDHEYASAGNYTIKLTVSSGSFSFYSNSNSYRTILSETASFNNSNRYSNDIKAIRLGSNTTFGVNALTYCTACTSITIPRIPITLISYTFSYCLNLKSIIVPNGTTSIGDYTFQNCSSLVSVAIPNGVTSIGANAFRDCNVLKTLTIPDGVTSIGNNGFYNCYNLTSLTIPSGVKSIGTSAFYNCYALKSFTIPSGVKSIGSSTFYHCYALKSLTIPSGVTSIGTSAFNGCSDMAEFHFLPTTPPTLGGTNAFSSVPTTCIFYVPAGSLGAYQTATNWSTYASRMVGE